MGGSITGLPGEFGDDALAWIAGGIDRPDCGAECVRLQNVPTHEGRTDRHLTSGCAGIARADSPRERLDASALGLLIEMPELGRLVPG
uniref:Uncharacterized protein n=1 Tax=Magnetospirillum gryphiswaldense TaxID=55518 RepID=A4TY11_9PROT|nr:hypothetical protein MGR_1598 [Magnetospirillum gryphiswaldense MSR-1]